MKAWLRTTWSRSRAVVSRRRLDREFDEELTTHLELLIDEGRRRGLSAADARREALRKLGRPVAIREVHREQRALPLLDMLAQDLRYAIRMLWKTPAFTGIVTLSLALGIGANTALFSLVDDLLLRSLPVRDPDRLVQVQQTSTMMGIRKTGIPFTKPAFDYIRTHNQVFAEIVGVNVLERPTVSIDGVSEPGRRVEQVSDNFFRDLGVAPVVGRTPESSDDAVAVLSHGLWRARFGSSPDVVGRALTIDGQTYPIIGVATPQFRGLSVENSADIWVSSRTAPSQQMIARVKPEVTSAEARAAMQVLFRQLAQAQPEVVRWNEGMQIELLSAGKGLSQLRAPYERPLLALSVLVTLVLLITCTNVGNLLMVRNSARRRELAVRAALGASRSRLVLQYLVESAVLATMGGILALIFARWGVSIILSMLPLVAIPDGLVFQPDARVLGFAAGLSLLCALLFGLAPAWRATHVDLTSPLRSSQGSTSTKRSRLLGRWLVSCQVALSVLLLVGAGLFVQTLRNLLRLDVGFKAESLLQVSLDTRGSGYGKGQVGPLHSLLLERVSAIPGVQSVTSIRNSVMKGNFSRSLMPIPGRTLSGDEAWDSAEVGPSFFETMAIPVVRGRTFAVADFAQGRPYVVISEAFAQHYFPNEDPVGKRIGRTARTEIIGVVRDTRLTAVRRESGPMMYFMAANEPDSVGALEVRTAGDADAIVRAVREEVRRVHPRLLIDIRTMRQEIDRNLAQERMVAATSGLFSLLGLLLVSVGIFGVASYTVAQRTSELGIRMALGASRWSVIRESLRDTMTVFGAGLAAGIIVAVAAVRLTAGFISDLLFGLTATDAANIVGAVLLIVAVALAACILPARRATRIDPLTAIRHE
jgi:macrolide transport system ATP-binding/permease protein